MRGNGLVALMDKDVATMMKAALADYWYDSAQTLAENRARCRLLGIYKEEDLQHIMRNGVPCLNCAPHSYRHHPYPAWHVTGVCPLH
uniref:hypothetical protein n=1 Tax=Salmonella enterica TaxID=28901 RepID=UPI00200DB8E4|nr:hypothetical protein [Salmonella enterica]UPI13729.1 hypothetical protein BNIPNGOD_00063 [Salmonella enterica subsp. enterica serovar Typhimurium]